MATIDPNGVLIYQDTDNYTPIHTALNLAQSNLSSLLGASTQIVKVSSVGDRNAKATARGSISKANPFVTWRADATDGLQLEYTTNGVTWRTIADKEYYERSDTGWLETAGSAGETVRMRRSGGVVTVHVTKASATSGSLVPVNAGNPIVAAGMRPYVFAEGGARGDVPGVSTLPCILEVMPDGVVRFYKPSNVTEYLFGTATYVAA